MSENISDAIAHDPAEAELLDLVDWIFDLPLTYGRALTCARSSFTDTTPQQHQLYPAGPHR